MLASDHLIRDRQTFLRKLKAAAAAAAARDCLVTFGIPPTFPSTGYGYIRYEKDAGFADRPATVFYPVRPSSRKSRAWSRPGRSWRRATTLWNSGMFLWRAGGLRRASSKRFAPGLLSALGPHPGRPAGRVAPPG